jgi:hypothetical protein
MREHDDSAGEGRNLDASESPLYSIRIPNSEEDIHHC